MSKSAPAYGCLILLLAVGAVVGGGAVVWFVLL